MRYFIIISLLALAGCIQMDSVSETPEFDKGIRYLYGNGVITFVVDNSLDDGSVDSLLTIHDLSLLETDSLMRYSEEKVSRSGWTLTAFDDEQISYSKPLKEFDGSNEALITDIIIGERVKLVDSEALDVVYGVNQGFRGEDPGLQTNGRTTLRFKGSGMESEVFISGTFNNWSTFEHPLQYRNDAWYIELDIEPGKHLYRFIADGQWKRDANNSALEEDTQGQMSNVLFVYNHVFEIQDFFNADIVEIQGSFNDWREHELVMRQEGSTWRLPMYLREGTHAYKLKVDGEWQLDPTNEVTRPDDAGYDNSFMSIGDTLYFELNGYSAAKEVYLSGDFNAWQHRELKMFRSDNGWTLPYVLRPGNFEYKFIVDGNWIADPNNPHSTGTGEYINSLRVVESNQHFQLEDYKDAEEVVITGDFMDWNEDGYRMARTANGWEIDLYLPRGKTKYKFRVDGEWIKDPANPLWETNEYGTRNSIIWKE